MNSFSMTSITLIIAMTMMTKDELICMFETVDPLVLSSTHPTKEQTYFHQHPHDDRYANGEEDNEYQKDEDEHEDDDY